MIKRMRSITHQFVITMRLLGCKSEPHHCSAVNFHTFVVSNPPLILFTLTSVLFVIVLTTLAYYVMANTAIHNPDVSSDWNVFLDNFANLEFCVTQKNRSKGHVEGFDSGVLEVPHWWPQSWDQRKARQQHIKSYSVVMSAVIQPKKDFVSNLHNVTHLHGTLPGKFIGIKGDTGVQKYNVSMVFSHDWSLDQCSLVNPLQECHAVTVEMCVEFRGSDLMFPSETKPKPCHKEKHRGKEYWASFNWQDLDSVSYCRSKTMINIQYTQDPALSKALKDMQRESSKKHLLWTSYLIILFVIGVLLYALLVNHQLVPAPGSPTYHKSIFAFNQQAWQRLLKKLTECVLRSKA